MQSAVTGREKQSENSVEFFPSIWHAFFFPFWMISEGVSWLAPLSLAGFLFDASLRFLSPPREKTNRATTSKPSLSQGKERKKERKEPAGLHA